MYAPAAEPGNHIFGRMLALSGALHVLTFLLSLLWLGLRSPSLVLSPVTVVDLISGGEFSVPAPVAVPKSLPTGKAARDAERRRKDEAPPAAKAEKKTGIRVVPPPETKALSERIRKMRREGKEKAKVREAVEAIQRERAARMAIRGIGEKVAHRIDLSSVRPADRRDGPSPPSAGMSGASGNVRVPPEIMAYARALDEKVRSNWTVPDLAVKDAGKLFVQVRITIEKDGRVGNVRMEKESGNPYFDDSVRRAIQKASPLPVPPEELRGGEDRYDVGFRFYWRGNS